MSLDAIDSLILSHYGLATRVMGPKALGRAVNRRLDALGLGGEAVDTYTELLRTSDDERQELLELLVVPETWFFRNEKVWPWLVRWATNEWRPKHPGQQLRVLSLACATGEEPWSIAMTLRDGGWSPRDFSIEAVDISSRALERATTGIYGRNSFRSFADRNVGPIAHHLIDVGQGLYQVRNDLRPSVTFRQGNLHDTTLINSLSHQRYDIVLCRNVMIYFPREGQKRVLSLLHHLMADDGRLLVGHSELIQFIDTRLVSTAVPNTFSYRKRLRTDAKALHTDEGDPALQAHATTPGASWNTSNAIHAPAAVPVDPPAWRPLPRLNSPAEPAHPAPVRSSSTGPASADLSMARRAADEGRLDDALNIACDWLSHNHPTADAHCLVGVISDARGDSDSAEHHLRRAVYLEPRHQEALVHLSLLLERNGDPSAANFQRRAMRAARTLS